MRAAGSGEIRHGIEGGQPRGIPSRSACTMRAMSPMEERMPPAGARASPVHGCMTRPERLVPMMAVGPSSSAVAGV